VFDGMGGEEKGETASFLAARVMQERAAAEVPDPEAYFASLCEEMNLAVCRENETLASGRMGTTMVSLLFSRGSVCACNLGDSRAFRYREGTLLQISTDHVETLGPADIRAGRKPRLIQHLGVPPRLLKLEPSTAECACKKGDVYLICSDGLTDMVSEERLAQLLGTGKSVRRIAERLLSAALDAGGRDNVTAIICAVE
jgi:protein phosphatase